MKWQRMSAEARRGDRILVFGGRWFRHNRGYAPQPFPVLVEWDGAEFALCDNQGDRAVITSPEWWCAVTPPEMDDDQSA